MKSSKEKYNSISFLWAKFQHGDYSILGNIFHNIYNELYYYGLKLVAQPYLVKDTIQDIFVDIWVRRQGMSKINNIRAYLFVSLKRELIRNAEKIRKENHMKNCSVEPFVFSPEDFKTSEETNSNVIKLLVQSMEKLTDRQREIILLRFNYELEFQEIAMIMDMNVQSVRNLLFRALSHIRKVMNNSKLKSTEDIEILLLNIFHKKSK